MNKNKHLLLWSSVGVFALLVIAAGQEHFGKEWRVVQQASRSTEGPVDVRLRQIVNPGLNISDRCVSCHIGMASGEAEMTGSPLAAAHKPVVHPTAEFGCTICHGGQGLATEKADAHGNVHFWPQPMLPMKYAYAGCGTCHAANNVPGFAAFEKSRSTFERLDCLACHRVDGRGGTLRPGGGGIEGPDLSFVGVKGFNPHWYEEHLQKHEQVSAGPWRDSFGTISDAERAALINFLATRVGAPKLIEAKAQFLSSGCIGCHKVSGLGGDAGPDLSRSGERDPGQLDFANVPGDRNLSNWLGEHFRSPLGVVPGSQMPMMGLSERQIDLLTMYVLSLRRRELPGAYLAKDRINVQRFGAREFTTDGATIFGAICAGCHGADGKGARYSGIPPFPAIAGPDFLQLASDELITETIKQGRPGRKMPAWANEAGLRPEEIRSVVTYLREMGGNVALTVDTSPARWVKGDATAGGKLFAANCAGCHGQKGEGGEGPALRNKVLLTSATDTFLVETIRKGRRGTAMKGFNEPSPVRRALVQSEIEAIVTFIRTWAGK